MCVYVRTKFQVSSIILTSFRREVILPTPFPTKRTPKNPTQIKVNLKIIPNRYTPCFKYKLFPQKSVSWWPSSRINILTVYYNLGQGVITNWGSFVFLQIGASVITDWGSLVVAKWSRRYYKLGQLLQIRATIITNWAAITNWSKHYYKLGQLLQIGAWQLSVKLNTYKSWVIYYLFIITISSDLVFWNYC